MKRGAESQLTKDAIEEGYVEPEETLETGFKKAPEEILKGRVIRGLPNRTKPSTNGTTPSPSFLPSVVSSGSAFPFTSTATTTNSFASPPAQSSASTNNTGSSLFAKIDPLNPFGVSTKPSSLFGSTSQNATSTTAFAFPSSSDTLISSTPSSTSKAFASVLNNSIFGSPVPTKSSSSTNQPSAADEDDPILYKYYINLRGLNHSFLTAISKRIEDDPFADMSGILELYKSMREKIQKEKEATPTASKPESSSSSSPATSSSSLFSMPAAPSPSPFGKSPAQGAQSSLSIFGTPSAPSTTSTSFFSPPSAGVPSNPFGFTSSITPKASDSSNETPSQSIFGAPSQKPSFFKPEESSSTTTTSLFGSTSSPFTFGNSTTNQSSPSIFGSNKPTSTFSWGATVSQPATGDLTAASDNSSTTASTPTPAAGSGVHFQFGSGSSGISQSQSKPAANEKTSDDTDAADGAGSEQATSTTGAGESGVSNLLAVHNPHDDEGEGEENEITVHAIKAKAYRMRKADAKGGPGWADLGFGILRLKTDKDTSARRMLLRNSTNGKILINFKIYSGLKPSLVKKALTFVGHDDGISQTYCLRLPGEEQAQQLKEALDREIESVTAKE